MRIYVLGFFKIIASNLFHLWFFSFIDKAQCWSFQDNGSWNFEINN